MRCQAGREHLGVSYEGALRVISECGQANALDDGMNSATEAFVAHRNLLFTVAYEMLGSAADAEDVLQETWLRWAGVDLDTVRNRRAYLVRITTRQALSRLRMLGRRRESYVGPTTWPRTSSWPQAYRWRCCWC
jgi:DNA-directed RNA polymerase specialized sigma24 family protein